MKRTNCFPLNRGDAAVLSSGSNTAKVSVRREWGGYCLVQLESDPDDRRVVERAYLKPRETSSTLFVEKRP